MTKFFDLHIFYNRNSGFSLPIAIDASDVVDFDNIQEDEVINKAIKTNRLDTADARQVDSVDEITEIEYNDMRV